MEVGSIQPNHEFIISLQYHLTRQYFVQLIHTLVSCHVVLHTLSSSAVPHPVVVCVHRIEGLIYASFTWRYNVQTVRHHDKPPRGIIPLYIP